MISFLFFTGLVAFLTWRLTRGRLDNTEEGYFLAGRSLSGVVIAGSLLLTNLSTEQLVGLNGDAYANGLAVMAWEVIAGASLVVLALFFCRATSSLGSQLSRNSWKSATGQLPGPSRPLSSS